MPSSISNSKKIGAALLGKPTNFIRASLILLLILVAVVLGLEWTSLTVATHSSRILSRSAREREEVKGFRRKPGGPKTVLLYGNSLLLEDVEFPRLHDQLQSGGWDARSLVVVQTSYLDWHFGMRRLFDEGCNPDVYVMILTPTQMAVDGYAGSIFAYYLMRGQDIFEVASATHIHPTEAAGLLFARYSSFYGLRADLRKNLLRYFIPGLNELRAHLIPLAIKPPPADLVSREVEKRMREERANIEQRGAKLVVVIPPVADPNDHSDVAIQACQRAGVAVLAPVSAGEFSPDMFTDGFHMGQAGAKIFTDRLIPELLKKINNQETQ